MNELLIALEKDNLVKIKSLCQQGIDLNTPIVMTQEYNLEDDEETNIIFYAIKNSISIEAIKILLEFGIDINQLNEDGLSAIDVAIKFKREDIVLLCIENGMDINKTFRQSGITPILLASCFNNISMVELLLKHGADINSSDKAGMSAKDYAKKLGQKKMLEFLERKGAKHNLYKDFDITNREKPTENMGFDSI